MCLTSNNIPKTDYPFTCGALSDERREWHIFCQTCKHPDAACPCRKWRHPGGYLIGVTEEPTISNRPPNALNAVVGSVCWHRRASTGPRDQSSCVTKRWDAPLNEDCLFPGRIFRWFLFVKNPNVLRRGWIYESSGSFSNPKKSTQIKSI